jgi:hypothetical protein
MQMAPKVAGHLCNPGTFCAGMCVGGGQTLPPEWTHSLQTPESTQFLQSFVFFLLCSIWGFNCDELVLILFVAAAARNLC